jgi:excisionase family DNA binding protein
MLFLSHYLIRCLWLLSEKQDFHYHEKMSMSDNNAEIDKFLTVGEAAKLLGMTYKTTHRHVVLGDLKGIKKGGRYLIPRTDIEHFKRRLAGRPRTSTPQWRFSPEGNLQIGTRVEVDLREGVSEEAFVRALEKVKRSDAHLFEGTIARYVMSDEHNLRRVQFLLIWRETVMPATDDIEQALAALGRELNSVLAWEGARSSTQRIWMHT